MIDKVKKEEIKNISLPRGLPAGWKHGFDMTGSLMIGDTTTTVGICLHVVPWPAPYRVMIGMGILIQPAKVALKSNCIMYAPETDMYINFLFQSFTNRTLIFPRSLNSINPTR